jgi:hypothetical protein
MTASISTAPRPGLRERPPEAPPRSAADAGCDVCPHPVGDHDAIALRFCRATRNTAITRGCVCRGA